MWIVINAIQLVLIFLWLIWPVCFVIPFAPTKIIYWVARKMWATGTLFLAGIFTKIEGRENLDKNENYVFVANHSSYADIPAMFIATQRDLRFIAKEELRKIPFLGYGIRKMDMIYLQRKDINSAYGSFTQATEKVKSGIDILIFPEGTRSKTENIMPFKRGAIQVAANAGVKIVPCAIKDAQKHWNLGNTRFRPGTIKIKIGVPFHIENNQQKTIAEYTKEIQAQVEKMLQEM